VVIEVYILYSTNHRNQGGATILRVAEWVGYIKQCCERSQQIFFCYYPSLVIFWGYVSRKWCKNSPFYLLHIGPYFTGSLELRCLWGPWGVTLETPLCGLERSGSENWMSESGAGAGREKIRWSGSGTGAGRPRSESGAVSGVTERGVSGERKFRPLSLRSRSAHML